MLKQLLTAASIATALCAVAPSARAELKIATVDVNAIWNGYSRTKDAEAKFKEAQQAVQKDMEGRMEALKKSMEDINKINADIEKPELSKDAKEKLAKDREGKVAIARNQDRELAEFRGTRERQLQEQYIRMRKDIIEDIMKAVNQKVQAAGYDIVLDRAGMSMGQIPVLLYARPDLDFSKEIIETLNKNAPKTPVKP